MGVKQQVAVSRRALIQRINRKLRDSDRMLKATRGERARVDVGDYYVIDVRVNGIVEKDVDLEETARDLGVLTAYERLVEE
jgi:hypothetical protein